eukprot:TRINITY_DN27548_c0_g1_i1.p1 TRINITY_DN27548_c0_g1~~TRINITY_DN27548_c0_g1_i1.p1  ORF type:complete len:165 (+),score=38.25 TRINITY_DN27548_c0_g1_i1:41-535(+)
MVAWVYVLLLCALAWSTHAAIVTVIWNTNTHVSNTINPNDTVVWTTNDGLNHDVVFDNPSNEVQDIGFFRMASRQLTFVTPGVYTYICSLHADSMTGTVNVTTETLATTTTTSAAMGTSMTTSSSTMSITASSSTTGPSSSSSRLPVALGMATMAFLAAMAMLM